MEEHRLKPMSDDYDKKVFEELYQKTKALKNKLTYGIDAGRFGLEYKDIRSWFDIKFIYVFNKYHKKYDKEVLLGHIINSLTMFKNRILRKSYNKDNIHKDVIDLTEVDFLENILEDKPKDDSMEILMQLTLTFMEARLSREALELFHLELEPSPYILKKMKEANKQNFKRIPDYLFADYLNLGTSNTAIEYIKSLRSEIRTAIEDAKLHFQNVQLPI